MISINQKGKSSEGSAQSLRHIAVDADGAAAMEFGLVAPVFLMMLIALFDLGQLAYTRSVLNGAVQVAARESALETGDTVAADAKVAEMVDFVAPDAIISSTRVSYYDFADVGRPEAWNDEDSSGTCDNDEPFSDENGNGLWDDDIGKSGNGGAGDVVIYTVKVAYEPLFAMPLMPYENGRRVIQSSAVKKNQPFADQIGYATTTGVCS